MRKKRAPNSTMKDLTTERFSELLKQHDGSVTRVAASLGVHLRTLENWITTNCPRQVVYGCQATSEGK